MADFGIVAADVVAGDVVAADVRRRNSSFKRNPPPHVGSYGPFRASLHQTWHRFPLTLVLP